MINWIKKWFYTKILKRTYIMSIDLSNGKDYSCKVEGYKDSKGDIQFTKVTYFE